MKSDKDGPESGDSRSRAPSTSSTPDATQDWYETDLQLAAELGKTLLERNQELEETVRQQQLLIEEQEQELQHLSRQAASLREVNESRLKIYEQLEQNVAELEKSNQRLQQESRADKKRIRSLSTSVDVLEKKCEELQELADHLRLNLRPRDQQDDTAEPVTAYHQNEPLEDASGADHVVPSGSPNGDTDFLGFEESPFGTELVRLRCSLSRLKCQLSKEQETREELQTEVDNLVQENMRLQEEVLASQEREHQCLNLQMEMDILEDDKRLCSNCRLLNRLDRCEEPEEELSELDHFSMVQLKDGLVVYGDQDSLPEVVDSRPVAQSQDAESQVSLLSELDAQYRLLIDKYEALLDARCRSLGLDGPVAEPTWAGTKSASPVSAVKKNDYPSLSTGSDAESAESGEASLSSGFSEVTTERVFTDQAVQTDTASAEARRQLALDLTAIKNQGDDPLGQHFSRSPPEYKKLFAEIFAVLKRTVTDGAISEKTELSPAAETAIVASCCKVAAAARSSSPKASCTPSPRKLNTHLDISKLCDVAPAPACPTEEVKYRLPGGITYAEAVRRGRLLRKATTERRTPRK
ncbi:cerebellar degeneration-related protein 2-like isoform X1 [Rhipicephalus sanguineus]|uniref:cerebellar degeneration-related protein 2-like isoform X1 n=1 Tax=Rhipicephalus sanguineus TaxID=34632 RepID=UPI001892DE07|nr:cerebellar degeneration-related protein 2-like isoform X1 [Rhipicephalus sanguineus]